MQGWGKPLVRWWHWGPPEKAEGVSYAIPGWVHRWKRPCSRAIMCLAGLMNSKKPSVLDCRGEIVVIGNKVGVKQRRGQTTQDLIACCKNSSTYWENKTKQKLGLSRAGTIYKEIQKRITENAVWMTNCRGMRINWRAQFWSCWNDPEDMCYCLGWGGIRSGEKRVQILDKHFR